MTDFRFCFVASRADIATSACERLERRYGSHDPHDADVIVALGGDGFMLQTLHATEGLDAPVYGMNRGTVGFLMNQFSEEDLPERIAEAEVAAIHPLRMKALDTAGDTHTALAINEVSLLRMGPQAAKLKIGVDGRERMAELVCDGALVSTPAGSTAYNYSAHGPILPIGADILALTAISAYRPRRWRGALLPSHTTVRFDVLEHEKRGVAAVADSQEVRDVVRVEIHSEPAVTHRLMFDPGHGLEERLIREQFV
ncbi:NAD kinase [Roseobacter sp. HKCCA0434]|uniref:NAD kinase n=1 Tax=Roseobacter sp. HKCCA0434 TaxID=3079297 RepID=UPI002905F389|nr:NAD kinase [Roseobacter sp. HKCCA0434]